MTEKAEFEAFKKKFKINELTIAEGEFWALSVRPAQITFGSLVLSAKFPALSFDELPQETAPEFLHWLKVYERIAKAKFGAERLNVICLMMVDPFVHFHVIPRFASDLQIAGSLWFDKNYPAPPDMAAGDTELDTLEHVKSLLMDALK